MIGYNMLTLWNLLICCFAKKTLFCHMVPEPIPSERDGAAVTEWSGNVTACLSIWEWWVTESHGGEGKYILVQNYGIQLRMV